MTHEPSPPLDPPAKYSRRWRIAGVLVLLFAATLAASWWLTPIRPFATIAFSPFGSLGGELTADGSLFVCVLRTSEEGADGATGRISVWDVMAERERFGIDVEGWSASRSVQFSSDNRMLAVLSLSDKQLTIFATTSGDRIVDLAADALSPNMLAPLLFFGNGPILAYPDVRGSPRKDHIVFWNVAARREIGCIEGHVSSLSLSQDGNTAATLSRDEGGRVQEVSYWRLKEVGPTLIRRQQLADHFVDVSVNRRTLATAKELPEGRAAVTITDLASGEQLRFEEIELRGARMDGMHFLGNGKILAIIEPIGGAGYKVWLWDSTASKFLGQFDNWVSVSPDGEWLAVLLKSGLGPRLIKRSEPEHSYDLVVDGDVADFRLGLQFSTDSKSLCVSGIALPERKAFLEAWLPKAFNPFRADPGGPVVRIWDVNARQQTLALRSGVPQAHYWDNRPFLVVPREKHIELWRTPLQPSAWHVIGWAVLAWGIVALAGWLVLRLRARTVH